MTRTLRRLARIQRIEQDEARQELLTVEQVRDDHGRELRRCHEAMDRSRAEMADSADDLMRRHSFSLRQEMLRRRLQDRAEELDVEVEQCRSGLLQAARRVKTTERFTDLLEAKVQGEQERRNQRQLDDIGLVGWRRRAGEVA